MLHHSREHEQHRPRRRARAIWTVLLAVGWPGNQAAGLVLHEPRPLDLVIALDHSASAFLPAGVDVDRDGIVGWISRRSAGASRPSTSDPGDTVFEAARAAARHLLEALSGSSVRVGLLSFGEETRVRARLGSPERALKALASIPLPLEPGATNLERAIRTGQSVLGAHHEGTREKILLILSDGHATRPWSPFLAEQAARRAARSAARSGISIHAVAIGPYAADSSSVYAELAALTQGAYFASRDLSWIREAPRVECTSASTGTRSSETARGGERR
jgi:uncharacterized protein (DUF58 family)